jgi:dTDP-4-amino-4,6-dideoxygalactose transaminase
MSRRLPAHPQLRWSDLRRRGRGVRWSKLDVPARLMRTYSGRGAICQALRVRRAQEASRKVVLVPAFHCPTVVDPILDAGFEVCFYGVDEKLRIDEADFLARLDGNVAAAVIIRYFGIADASASLRKAVRNAGAWILDDCSHSFLRANPVRLADAQADATTYSFWKLLPSMTGGGVLFGSETALRLAQPQQAPALGLRAMLGQLLDEPQRALRNLRKPDVEPEPRPVVRGTAAEAYPYVAAESRWGMSPLAARVLRAADPDTVVAQRRANYVALAGALAPTPEMELVWPTLDEEACPWGLPVLLKRRPERDYLIRARGVPLFSFGEVLHPLVFEQPDVAPRAVEIARYLSDTLLVLSIHQGLTVDQVRQSARAINAFFAE